MTVHEQDDDLVLPALEPSRGFERRLMARLDELESLRRQADSGGRLGALLWWACVTLSSAGVLCVALGLLPSPAQAVEVALVPLSAMAAPVLASSRIAGLLTALAIGLAGTWMLQVMRAGRRRGEVRG